MAATLRPTIRLLLRTFLSIYRFFALYISWFIRLVTGNRGTKAEERVLTGKSWDEFCDMLKAAGASLQAPGAPRDAFNQAEGYRYLARLARAGLENFVECHDVEAPRLCAIANGSRAARVCIGADNPDNLYENAAIDGRLEYVLSGTRGSVGYLGFGTQSGQYGGKGGLQTVAYLEAEQLEYDEGTAALPPAERTFTIILSAVRPPDAPNWLQLLPEPREAMCIVRQTFGDRRLETAAEVTISRRGSDGSIVRPSPLTAEKLDEGLCAAGVLVAGASAMFAKWSYGFQQRTNELVLFDQERSDKAGGDPNIRYYHSYWSLQPGQVLRIRARPPPCRCWNFQLNNHWMESLDYRHHTIHTNSTLARPDDAEPGLYTILICAADPNFDGKFRGNWIETTGHAQGTMCFRWIAPDAEHDGDKLPHPKADVVDWATLFGITGHTALLVRSATPELHDLYASLDDTTKRA